MTHGLVVTFVVLSGIFAFVHWIAVTASLYWYYWWFDIVMHLWGGALITLGVFAFSTLQLIGLRPTFTMVLLALVLTTGAWEVFEFAVGLWDPQTYLFDTSKDVLVGLSGGLLTYAFLWNRYNEMV
jgi:hypothetical protein